MLTRKAWPMALSVVVVGSVAVIVHGNDSPPTSASPAAKPAEPPAAAASPAEPRKPVKPKDLSDAAKKGLAYLVSQQNENGGFGQGGGWRLAGQGANGRVEGKEVKDPPDVGNTCIAALALIRAGNSPKAGPYARQLSRAIEFIETHVEQADNDSLYVTPVRDTQLQSKIGRYVDTFLTALVLSELKGQMPDAKSEERLFAALNKTIGKIESNQQADGTFAGNAGWASVLSQGLCSKALNRASQKGIAVKDETLKRDLGQSVAQLTPEKSPTAAGPAAGAVAAESSGRSGRASSGTGYSSAASKGDAGVTLYSLSANAGRVQDTVNTNSIRKQKAESVLNSPTADERSKDIARGALKEVAEAEVANRAATKQVVDNLDRSQFVRGFGNNGGEEFLSYMNISETLLVQGGEAWEKWDRQACETITKAQNDDGSWSGHHCITGRTFCTAAALLTMMADRAPLPVTAVEAAPAKPAAK